MGFKKQFMLSKVNATEIQRTRPRDSSREEIRNKFYIYSFFINGKRKIICKKFVSQYFVYKLTIC